MTIVSFFFFLIAMWLYDFPSTTCYEIMTIVAYSPTVPLSFFLIELIVWAYSSGSVEELQ